MTRMAEKPQAVKRSDQKPSLDGQLPTNVFVATSSNRIKRFLNAMIEEAIHRGPIFSR